MASPPDPVSLDRPWVASYPPGVPPTYRLPDVALPRLLDDAARDFPDHLGVVAGRTSWTFAELHGHVGQLDQVLRQHGIQAGDRVLVTLPTGTSLLVVLMALWRRGAVPVPVPVDADAGDLADVATESAVVAVMGTPGSIEGLARQDVVLRLSISVAGDEWEARGRRRRPGLRLARPLRGGAGSDRTTGDDGVGEQTKGADHDPDQPPVTRRLRELLAEASSASADAPVAHDEAADGPVPDAPALVSVGLRRGGPSAVEHTHRTLIAAAFQSRLWIPDVQAGRERMLIAEPLHDIVGLAIGLLSALLSGATSMLLPDPSRASLAKTIERHQPTLLLARSERVARLVEDANGGRRDLTSLRVCLAVGDPVPPSLAHALEDRSSGARIRTVRGCGDAAPITHGQPVYGRRVPTAAGLPVTDTLAVVVEAEDLGTPCAVGRTGVLLVRGPQIPEVGAMCADGRTVDGWLVTRDLARVDDDGWFTILGDRDGLMDRGDDPVPARRVATSLRRRVDVRDAEVVRVGAGVIAAVVGVRRRAPHPDDLMADLSGEFGPRGLPDRIVVVAELPRTSDGGVDRPKLADQLRDWLEPPDRETAGAADRPDEGTRE